MIISGIAATPAAALGGHVLLAGAVDVARPVPLCIEHGREVGEVTSLMYAGHDLFVVAETDDETALKLDYFSVAGKPVVKQQHGNLFHVTKFKLLEVSLVRVPQNDRCIVIDRKPSDPLRQLYKARSHQIDLFKQAFTVFGKILQQAAR